MKDKEKLSAPIKNRDQAQYYLDCGCIAKVWGSQYNEGKGKHFWFLRFELNSTYFESKNSWMQKTR